MPALGRMPTGKREELAERRAKVWELRKAGYSTRKIAKALGVSISPIKHDIQVTLRELGAQMTEDLTAYRAEELERLNTLLTGMWKSACGGDVAAAMVCIRIAERRAKLLGLDAPVKVQAEGVSFVQVLQQVAARLDVTMPPIESSASDQPAS